MPTLAEYKTAALAELAIHLPATTEPQLSSAELDALLASTLIATVWTASTAYTYGAKVMPVNRVGHVYVATAGGTSGTVEPTWPTAEGSTVKDGTVTWKEVAADTASPYDVRAAAKAGWLKKAGKVTVVYDRGGEHASQVLRHCLEMAERYSSLKVA